RPEHDWARSEGLAEPRLLDGRGAAQGRGHSSVDGQGPDAVGGLAPIARAGDDGRPDAAVAMGLQEPRQAGDGASRPGSQSEFLDHSQAAGGTEILSPFQPQDQGSRQTPDRDAQFEYINAKVEAFQAAGEPVISIDAKKKELLGEFKNGGSDYGPQGEPIEVNAHDFEDKELGKVVPYGVYDIGANLGYVSLGIDHDTGEFAVNAVRCWLDQMGWKLYPGMRRLMITADGGGSNGSRLRLWKL